MIYSRFPSGPDDDYVPPAYNGCTCCCHRMPGVKHVMACCWPTLEKEPELKEIVDEPKPAKD